MPEDKAPPRPVDLSEESLGFKRQTMARWMSPKELIKIALNVVVSSLFGSYTDRRQTLAALAKSEVDETHANKEELWFDYVADLGDGFDSTYTVAKILAESKLTVEKHELNLPRGEFLIMGGDQVYPSSSRKQYLDRVEGPYRAALPWLEKDQPTLYALPGNHDWYDGLTSFVRLFCQKRWIGAWKTKQSASYFAIQLPHNWWLFGVDIQLGADIDNLQKEYFLEIIENKLRANDKVIFASAVPSWIFAGLCEDRNDHENIAFIEKYIVKKGASIRVNVAGDLHHYARYVKDEEDAENSRYKITAGGGGAFLHGTHTLPEKIENREPSLGDDPETNEYTLNETSIFPSRTESKKLLLGLFSFPFRNTEMSVFLGAAFLLLLWFLQSGSLALESSLFDFIFSHQAPAPQFSAFLLKIGDICLVSPLSAFTFLIFFGALIAFVELYAGNESVRRSALKISLGATHAALHILLLAALIFLLPTVNLTLLNTSGNTYGVALLATELFIIGGLLSSYIMATYLLLTNYFLKAHGEAALSASRIEEYKNFLRLHINHNGELKIYPIGIRTIEKDWVANDKGEASDSWIVPKNGKSMSEYIHFIEDIRAQK